mgnify:CR=1 FL=1
MQPSVLINGEETRTIDVQDRGFQYGDGVFTSLLVHQRTPLYLDQHLRRLERDCARLQISYPGHVLLQQDIGRLLLNGDDGQAVLKIQLTRGIGARGYGFSDTMIATRVLTLNSCPVYSARIADEGIRITLCNTRLGINPLLAGIKHTNRLEQILARAELNHTDCLEGILLDQQGDVTEGIMTNIFLVKNALITTPRLDRCGVSGVMRGIVMNMLRQCGKHPVETRVSLEDIIQADEVFLTNSVLGIWSVASLDHHDYFSRSVALELRKSLPQPYRNTGSTA